MTIVLGLNAFHADASSVLLEGKSGRILAAVAEERLTRVKHAGGFPEQAIRECLRISGVPIRDISDVAVARDPFANLSGKIRFALGNVPRLRKMAGPRLANRARMASLGRLLEEFSGGSLQAQIHRVEHHRAHAASAYFVSGFDRAAVLTLDGFGDFASGMTAVGEGSRLRVLGRTLFPHSLGALYTAVSQFLGFPDCGDESKVMGLAAYGEDEFAPAFSDMVCLLPEGGFELDPTWFRFPQEGFDYTFDERGAPRIGAFYGEKMEKSFGSPRRPEDPITDRDRDLAKSLQECLERVVLHQLRALQAKTALTDLALAGGVALNCVANGRILRDTPFRRLFIQPAAGDDGTALGAALHVAHEVRGCAERPPMESAALGSSFDEGEMLGALRGAGLSATRLGDEELVRRAAGILESGGLVGWFQGRMEWGPRALGRRSILADPRRAEMREILNRRIKHREEFRPFAPVLPRESLDDYFSGAHPSPFMLVAFPVRPGKRSQIPAVTHVDGTARVQSVEKGENPLLHSLLTEFGRRTGVPVLLNTSFNENEPIVCRPGEALDCFRRTGLDALALGPYWCEKKGASLSGGGT